MKITNGKIIIGIGIIHTALTPLAYFKQFAGFAKQFFFSVSGGPLDSPSVMGGLYYETFAAFWCFYFGILMFPLGMLLDAIEKRGIQIPTRFIWAYFIITIIGVYMIPFSGMTVFFLPHSVYMLIKYRGGSK
jgi:hypothetical protein